MEALEAAGRGAGGLIAPMFWLGALIRQARYFHPDGVVYRAEVRPLVRESAVGALAQRLAGPALVRLSGGWWRWRPDRSLPDALGVAVRFRERDEVSAKAAPGDQDLIFGSFPSLWTLPIAPILTDAHDFQSNIYYSVLPYEVAGLRRVKWRLVPLAPSPEGGDRRERLERAVAGGRASFLLELRQARGAWTRVAEIALRERVPVNQQALRFTPFRTGRGIVPSGFVQAARAAAYAASQAGRRIAATGHA